MIRPSECRRCLVRIGGLWAHELAVIEERQGEEARAAAIDKRYGRVHASHQDGPSCRVPR